MHFTIDRVHSRFPAFLIIFLYATRKRVFGVETSPQEELRSPRRGAPATHALYSEIVAGVSHCVLANKPNSGKQEIQIPDPKK